MRRIALAAVPLAALAAVLALSARGGPERSQLRIVRVASGLTEPIAVTAPRNEPNNVYVAEKVGRVRVIVRGRLRARPFLDIRSLVLDSGEQGLLGLAFSPKYAKNRHFYVDYTDRNGDARIVEYKSRGLVAQAEEAAADLLPGRSLSEPQRRPARVRARRLPLHGNGRRRLRRRSGEPGAEPEVDLRQAAEVQRRAKASAAAHRRLRAAEPLALLVRPPDRRPVHRRRRPGLLGGARLHASAARPGSRTTAGASTRASRGTREPGAERGRASRRSRTSSCRTRRTAR